MVAAATMPVNPSPRLRLYWATTMNLSRLFGSLLILSTSLFQLAFASPVATALTSDSSIASKTIYLIRHGEKPPNEEDNELSEKGILRSYCIRELFGPDSLFNIGLIATVTPIELPDGTVLHLRHKQTIDPLAKVLGLPVNTCHALSEGGDPDCVYRLTEEFFRTNPTDDAAIISWKHSELPTIARALGASNSPEKWGKRYDFIWTIRNGTLISITHQHCPGLDDLETPDSGKDDKVKHTLLRTSPLRIQ